MKIPEGDPGDMLSQMCSSSLNYIVAAGLSAKGCNNGDVGRYEEWNQW